MATSNGMVAILLVVGFMILIAIADLVNDGNDIAAVLLGAGYIGLVLMLIGDKP